MFTILNQSLTATSTGSSAISISAAYKSLNWQLDVTGASTSASDTCTVYIQTTLDGSKFTDIVAFNALAGNGGAKRYLAHTVATEPQAMFENATALSTGSIRHIHGEQYRTRWDISGTLSNFTTNVIAVPNS